MVTHVDKQETKGTNAQNILKRTRLEYFLVAIILLLVLLECYSSASQEHGVEYVSNTVYVDKKASILDLNKFSSQSDFIYNNFSKNIVLASKNSVSGIISLHASDGSVYFTSKGSEFVIVGDLFNINTGSRLSVESRAIRYLSESDSFDSDESQAKVIQSPVEINLTALASEKYIDIMKKKMESISTASPIKLEEIPTTYIPPPDNDIDESCLITFGGFNQPKIGYDESCNVLSAEAKRVQIKSLINGFPDEFFIKHQAENERGEIYVFTDYTCGYCKKLHREVDSFLTNGISVNYILYPRAIGMENNDAAREVVTNMSSAWCSADQVAAIDKLYQSSYIPFTECDKKDEKLDSPVRQHYILGMMFGIEGTPLIVSSNGETTYGFRSVGTTLTKLKM